MMTYAERYEKHAEENEKAEGDAIDARMADYRQQLTSGKINIAWLRNLHEMIRVDQLAEMPRPILTESAIRAARNYKAIHEILSTTAN